MSDSGWTTVDHAFDRNWRTMSECRRCGRHRDHDIHYASILAERKGEKAVASLEKGREQAKVIRSAIMRLPRDSRNLRELVLLVDNLETGKEEPL